MSVWRDWSSVVCSSDVVCAVLVLPLKFGVLAFGRYSAKIVYVLLAVVPVGMVYVTLAAPLATVVLVAAVPIVVVQIGRASCRERALTSARAAWVTEEII